MKDRTLLMIPGPIEFEPAVLAALVLALALPMAARIGRRATWPAGVLYLPLSFARAYARAAGLVCGFLRFALPAVILGAPPVRPASREPTPREECP